MSVITLGLAAGIGYVLRSQGLANTANWTQLVLFVVAILQLTPSARGFGAAMSDSAENLEKVRQTLATLVLAQWRAEILVRQLDNPEPLTVRWELTRREVMDHAGQVFAGGKGGAQRAAKLPAATDRIGALAGDFRALRRRRLVILGEPGMGKTTLAVLMLRHLLEHPETGEPVPVLMPVSGWNPEAESFRDWMTRRLGEDYPALRSPAFGRTGHRVLVAGHQVLPVLDGLDEIPGPARAAVIAALNSALTESDPLILTCRTTEFEQAVRSPGGEILRAAAVIEPLPLRADDIGTYLDDLLGPAPQGSWPGLLAGIRAGRDTALTDALTTPLALWLLRKVYIDPHADPGELTALGEPRAVVDHLLDHLVPAVLSPAATPWKPDDARRWLGYLARRLSARHSRDIAWWELHEDLPDRRVTFLAGLIQGMAGGVLNGLVCGLAIWGGWRWAHGSMAMTIGVTGGLVAGLAFAICAGLFTAPVALPAYADLRLRGRVSPLVHQLRLGFMIGPPAGLVISLVLTPLLGAAMALVLGLSIGISTGVAGALADWAKVPLSDDQAQSPGGTFRRDTQLTYIRILSAALTLAPAAGLAGGLALRSRAGQPAGLIDAAVLGIILGPLLAIAGRLKFTSGGVLPPGTVRGPRFLGSRAGLTPGRLEAGGIFRVSVLELSRRGLLPLRLLPFLEDAHQLGLLRQVGNVYQFRHAELQDRLAQTYQP